MNKKSKKNSSKKAKKKMAQREDQSSAPAELLFEVGVEELPYQFIAPALSFIKTHAAVLFDSHRLSHGSITTFGTPRRLVLVVEALATRQTARTDEVMGPSKSVGFDQAGRPTKAAMGFAGGQGVPVESLQVKTTPKGEYLFAIKEAPCRQTHVVLLEALPELINQLAFPKAMKWNESGVRFARPVRWILSLLAGKVLPVKAAGIEAGHQTYGHRVKGSKPIVVRDFASYAKALEGHKVMIDPTTRREVIHNQLRQCCAKANVELNADESLLDQAVYTTEWPHVIQGGFKAEYLAMPSEILMTSMKEHQGFFSVRGKQSATLAPHFLAVANNQLEDMSLIRAGNERVLAARLADAKFFFDDDRRTRLDERVKRLGGVIFHQKLGTMAQKQERIRKLAAVIASDYDQRDELLAICDRAAALCKADLLTGIVGEFPELQGIMGGEYAAHDGEPEAVCLAIREQYLPRALEGDLPATAGGRVLSLADRLDSIAAFFHVGMVPTGSEDPFALRRHATAIVRIILEGELRLNLVKCLDHAKRLVGEHGFKGTGDSEQEGHRRVIEFLFDRVRHYGRTVHALREDVMEAVFRSVSINDTVDLLDILRKMLALQGITARAEFDPLIIGFKRASRIVDKERWDRKPVNATLFVDPAEGKLHRQFETSSSEFGMEMRQGRYDQALDRLVGLKPGIDAFFAEVMVNSEDQQLRSNRLSLLKDVEELFKSFADFSRIVVQGS